MREWLRELWRQWKEPNPAERITWLKGSSPYLRAEDILFLFNPRWPMCVAVLVGVVNTGIAWWITVKLNEGQPSWLGVWFGGYRLVLWCVLVWGILFRHRVLFQDWVPPTVKGRMVLFLLLVMYAFLGILGPVLGG